MFTLMWAGWTHSCSSEEVGQHTISSCKSNGPLYVQTASYINLVAVALIVSYFLQIRKLQTHAFVKQISIHEVLRRYESRAHNYCARWPPLAVWEAAHTSWHCSILLYGQQMFQKLLVISPMITSLECCVHNYYGKSMHWFLHSSRHPGINL